MNVTAELFLSGNMMVYFWTGKHSTNIVLTFLCMIYSYFGA